MKWILILIVTINPTFDGRGGSSVGIEKVEFASRAACLEALSTLKRDAAKVYNGNNETHVEGACIEDK